jgi:hypothetical protein
MFASSLCSLFPSVDPTENIQRYYKNDSVLLSTCKVATALKDMCKSIVNGPDDGVLWSGLLSFWPYWGSDVLKTQHIPKRCVLLNTERWIKFRLSVIPRYASALVKSVGPIWILFAVFWSTRLNLIFIWMLLLIYTYFNTGERNNNIPANNKHIFLC